MIAIILFLICIIASSVGAVVGAGGGVIIKPVLDMTGMLPVSTVSFCSGCTVLCMAISSLIRTRNNNVKLQLRTSTALALGAVLGGLAGKWLFELVRNSFGNDHVLGATQAACLAVITIGVFLYLCKKDQLPTKQVKNLPLTLIMGILLGVISSFLGIGGGPINLAVLFFFFSMDAKEAAKNSLYIIIFSQAASLASALLGNSVPTFEWSHLIAMICGGVGGALIGAMWQKRMNNQGVEKLLKILTLAIIVLCFYNIIKYTLL